MLAPCAHEAVSIVPASGLRQTASSPKLLGIGTLYSSTPCTRLNEAWVRGAMHKLRYCMLTDVISPYRRGRGAVSATIDAVAKRQVIVVFAEHRAAEFLHRFDGRLGGLGSYDMYWRLQLTGTL